MALEDWIDGVVEAMGGIVGHTGKSLKTYRVSARGEIPEALQEYPCAIIYPTRLLGAQYSMGGPCKELWEVRGEFYLFPDTKKTNMPNLIRYFAKIRDATLVSMTLGGKVDHFRFAEGEALSLVTMAYAADTAECQGIVALWEIKADVTSEVGAVIGK